jgi:hypothetical protein
MYTILDTLILSIFMILVEFYEISKLELKNKNKTFIYTANNDFKYSKNKNVDL